MKREEAIKCIKELIKSFYNCRGEENATEVSLDDVDMEALDMAIKALERQPCEDCISRQAVMELPRYTTVIGEIVYLDGIKALPPVQPKAKSEWIPIKTRPLTEEEKKEMDTESDYMYNCLLPDDGEEVEVTTYLGDVTLDVFCRDSSGGCYFEHYCDDGDVLAWRHKPEPYKAESEVTE